MYSKDFNNLSDLNSISSRDAKKQRLSKRHTEKHDSLEAGVKRRKTGEREDTEMNIIPPIPDPFKDLDIAKEKENLK